MKILRTPDERFANLPGYPFQPHYLNVPDGKGGGPWASITWTKAPRPPGLFSCSTASPRGAICIAR
jgi:hypothetical protein